MEELEMILNSWFKNIYYDEDDEIQKSKFENIMNSKKVMIKSIYKSGFRIWRLHLFLNAILFDIDFSLCYENGCWRVCKFHKATRNGISII